MNKEEQLFLVSHQGPHEHIELRIYGTGEHQAHYIPIYLNPTEAVEFNDAWKSTFNILMGRDQEPILIKPRSWPYVPSDSDIPEASGEVGDSHTILSEPRA